MILKNLNEMIKRDKILLKILFKIDFDYILNILIIKI